jgi:hypothetical protein
MVAVSFLCPMDLDTGALLLAGAFDLLLAAIICNSSRFPVWRVTRLPMHRRGTTTRRCSDGWIGRSGAPFDDSPAVSIPTQFAIYLACSASQICASYPVSASRRRRVGADAPPHLRWMRRRSMGG